jgi:hypothetical protein
MQQDLAIKALSIKRKGRLTQSESQQIADMQKAYGKNNVISAIRFSKSAQIPDVAKMLLQHCGVRTVIPPSISSILPDKSTAEKTWSSEKFQIATRLASATISIEKEISELAESLLKIVEEQMGRERMTKSIVFAINGSVRKYGFAFANRCVQLVHWNTYTSEEQAIKIYQELLTFSSHRDWQVVEDILGGLDALTFAGMPRPVSIRLNKYFAAKANRMPTDDESEILWGMLAGHSVDEIIHAMSCIPSVEFSIRKVEKKLEPEYFIGEENDEEDNEDDFENEDDGYIEKDWKTINEENQEFYDYSTFDENA